jgi:hypothetical protein
VLLRGVCDVVRLTRRRKEVCAAEAPATEPTVNCTQICFVQKNMRLRELRWSTYIIII